MLKKLLALMVLVIVGGAVLGFLGALVVCTWPKPLFFLAALLVFGGVYGILLILLWSWKTLFKV